MQERIDLKKNSSSLTQPDFDLFGLRDLAIQFATTLLAGGWLHEVGWLGREGTFLPRIGAFHRTNQVPSYSRLVSWVGWPVG